MYAQLTFFQTRAPVVRDYISLEERSIYSSNGVFSKANSSHLTIQDQFILDQLQSGLSSQDEINGIFYFHIPVSLSLERLRQRNKEADAFIEAEYLYRVERAYDDWLTNQPCGGAPVVKIDGANPPSPDSLFMEMEALQETLQ